MVFIINLTRKKSFSKLRPWTAEAVRRWRESSLNGTGAGTPGGLIASKEAARRTLKTEYNPAASIREVCRDYAKGSRPKENGEA